ncbi:DUF2069 domain-containing protein [Vibrio sp. WXL103]|uniref:DUF2069 domain-containing protein n=1 Tax=unclassified Vibrio TaxID=2614977 RepID=UPI003EC737D5
MDNLTTTTRRVRYFALCAHLALLIWVVVWQSTLSPNPQISPIALTLLWATPLLLPLPGMLAGKPYTHAWTNFILMLYFLHSLTIVYLDEGERWLAIVELVIVSAAFIANTLYARMRGRELGQRLKKISELERIEKQKYGAKE